MAKGEKKDKVDAAIEIRDVGLAENLGPIRVPSTHKRRSAIYEIVDAPVIEKGKWAVAVYDIRALGRIVGHAVEKAEWEAGKGYTRSTWDFPETREEALALALELSGKGGAAS